VICQNVSVSQEYTAKNNDSSSGELKALLNMAA